MKDELTNFLENPLIKELEVKFIVVNYYKEYSQCCFLTSLHYEDETQATPYDFRNRYEKQYNQLYGELHTILKNATIDPDLVNDSYHHNRGQLIALTPEGLEQLKNNLLDEKHQLVLEAENVHANSGNKIVKKSLR